MNFKLVLLLLVVFVVGVDARFRLKTSDEECDERVGAGKREFHDRFCTLCGEVDESRGTEYADKCRENCYDNDAARECVKEMRDVIDSQEE